MKRRKFLSLFTLPMLLGSRAHLRAAPRPKGFIDLFDGHTLDGWHTNVGSIIHGTGGRWRVHQGAIVGEQDPPGSGNGGLLMSDMQFGDFELLVDMAPDFGIDSGVFLRTNPQGECFQVYVDYREDGNIGFLSTETRNGQKRMIIRPFAFDGVFDSNGNLTDLTTRPDRRDIAWKPDYLKYHCTPEAWKNAWKMGQWNTLRVRIYGKYPKITTWINNTKLAEFDGETCPQPNYDKDKMFKALGRRGSIALQVHHGTGWKEGAVCRWKNIRVRPL